MSFDASRALTPDRWPAIAKAAVRVLQLQHDDYERGVSAALERFSVLEAQERLPASPLALGRIARNAAIDELRSFRRLRGVRVQLVDDQALEWILWSYEDGFQRVLEQEEAAQLADRLREVCQSAWELQLLQRLAVGVSKKDLAGELGVQPSRISESLAAIRKRLA